MTEQVRERERESDEVPETRYERVIREMMAARQVQLTGDLVSEGTPWQQNRQGLVRNYDVGLVPIGWNIFREHVQRHSGKHRHQGGLALYVLAGEGYSVVDGQRHDWKAGDLLLLPVQPGGVEHQHFDTGSDGETHWIAFWYKPWREALGDVMVQITNNPVFDEQQEATK